MINHPDYREVSWKIRRLGPNLPEGYKNILNWMERELPAEESWGSILEFGCDAADYTPHLARRADLLRACDPSSAQIGANCQAHPSISFFVQDPGKSIAAEPKTFDAIWCSDALAQLIQPVFALHEFHRVLKPGGRLLITVPYHGFFKNLLIALSGWDRHFSPDQPYLRFYTEQMLTDLIRKTGFREIQIETCRGEKPLRHLGAPAMLLLSAKK